MQNGEDKKMKEKKVDCVMTHKRANTNLSCCCSTNILVFVKEWGASIAIFTSSNFR